jgi:tryptophan synthase alpha chain
MMPNRIDNVFTNHNILKLMTHVVAGYPSIDDNIRLIKKMAENGVDLVEIQVPFSDPLADGPTIMRATQQALNNGINPYDCFALAKEVSNYVEFPLIIMSYVNIPFRMGVEKFISKCVEAGISGAIIPDIPFDELDSDYYSIAKKYGLYAIPVISPDVKTERLKIVAQKGDGFIYSTLKVGITGALQQINNSGLLFLDTIRQYTSLPIAAGFGISSPHHIQQLKGKADIAVIGSHIINVYDNHGIEAVAEFISQCKTEVLNAKN